MCMQVSMCVCGMCMYAMQDYVHVSTCLVQCIGAIAMRLCGIV